MGRLLSEKEWRKRVKEESPSRWKDMSPAERKKASKQARADQKKGRKLGYGK